MKYNSKIHHRHSIRLPDYDYSQEGLYFVTICVQDRKCLFGEIANEKMRLNDLGRITRDEWVKTAKLRSNVQIHDFVVMPNHFHAILEIVDISITQHIQLPQSRFQNQGKNTLSSIIGSFKSAVTKSIRTAGYDFAWQRNYYEHIVRDSNDHARIAEYIVNNPVKWNVDMFYKK